MQPTLEQGKVSVMAGRQEKGDQQQQQQKVPSIQKFQKLKL